MVKSCTSDHNIIIIKFRSKVIMIVLWLNVQQQFNNSTQINCVHGIYVNVLYLCYLFSVNKPSFVFCFQQRLSSYICCIIHLVRVLYMVSLDIILNKCIVMNRYEVRGFTGVHPGEYTPLVWFYFDKISLNLLCI